MSEDLYIEYIRKGLTGSLSDDERMKLEAWKDEREEHRLLAEDLYRAWEVSDQYGSDLNIDVEADYTIVKNKLQPPKGNIRSIRPAIWWSIAASFVVLLAAVFLLDDDDLQEVIATVDKQEVLLPDGSKAYLAKGTRLTYERDFGDDREIELDGNALLEVVHNAQIPFEVHSPSLITTVLGTTFFVEDASGADGSQVQLIEGKVSVLHKRSKKTEVLLPNERVVVTDRITMEKLPILKTIDFDWYFDDLTFDSEELASVARRLSSRYGIEISINAELSECPFSGNISNQPLNEILNSIAGVFGAQLIKSQDGITGYAIVNGQCE